MAAQSQGIKKLMQAEKEAAQVVANARKSKSVLLRVVLKSYTRGEKLREGEILQFYSQV